MAKLIIMFMLIFWFYMGLKWWEECTLDNSKTNRLIESFIMGFCAALPVTLLLCIVIFLLYVLFS